MKTSSKKTVLLLGVALLFAACGHNPSDSTAELAGITIYEFPASQYARPSRQDNTRSIADLLADCESQIDRIKGSFSACIGMPHKTAFAR